MWLKEQKIIGRDGRLKISLTCYILSTWDKSIELEAVIYRILLRGR